MRVPRSQIVSIYLTLGAIVLATIVGLALHPSIKVTVVTLAVVASIICTVMLTKMSEHYTLLLKINRKIASREPTVADYEADSDM